MAGGEEMKAEHLLEAIRETGRAIPYSVDPKEQRIYESIQEALRGIVARAERYEAIENTPTLCADCGRMHVGESLYCTKCERERGGRYSVKEMPLQSSQPQTAPYPLPDNQTSF